MRARCASPGRSRGICQWGGWRVRRSIRRRPCRCIRPLSNFGEAEAICESVAVANSVPPDEIENLVVERARLFPGHGVSGVVDLGPLVILQGARPEPHQRRRRQQIGIGRDDERRRRDGGDLGQRVRCAQRRLKARARLARMLVDLDPALGAFRIGAAIRRADFTIMRGLLSDFGNSDAGDELGDILDPRWRRYWRRR